MFQILCQSLQTRARTGVLPLVHGSVLTPAFMPVGTLATVKALSPEELWACGAQIVLSNTYHLYLRPGCETIARFGGLHEFMGWRGPVLTDSGGFQIFSLAKLMTIQEEGAQFQSHIDGSRHLLSPEKATEVQLCLNSDILMCLDQCIPYPADRKQAEDALALTTRWAARCKDRWRQSSGENLLFGIVQGGMYADLRARSAAELAALDLPGYAVGGLSVGEPKELMLEMADCSLPMLPAEKPRYIMGVGTPLDLVDLVALGADMFDCVMPSRNARNGQLFTEHGPINISNSRFREDTEPIEAGCDCYTCQRFSRAYLRHLYINRELLAYRLNTLHNLRFYLRLMEDIREAITKGRFDRFHRDFREKFNSQGESDKG